MITLHATFAAEYEASSFLHLWAMTTRHSLAGRDNANQIKAGYSILPHQPLSRLLCPLLEPFDPKRSPAHTVTLYLPDPAGLAAAAVSVSVQKGTPPSNDVTRLVPVNVAALLLRSEPLLDVLTHLAAAPLPRGMTVGSSVQFWITVLRWIDDLVTREQVRPAVVPRPSGAGTQPASAWVPLKTEAVTEDLSMLAAAMPLVGCAFTPDFPAEETLLRFVEDRVDRLVRDRLAGCNPLPWRRGNRIWPAFVGTLFERRHPLAGVMSDASVRNLTRSLQAWLAENEGKNLDGPTPPTQLVLRLAPDVDEADVDDPDDDDHADGARTSATTRWIPGDRWQLEYWIRKGVEAGSPARPLPDFAASTDPVDAARLAFGLRRLAALTDAIPAVRSSLGKWPPVGCAIDWEEAQRLMAAGREVAGTEVASPPSSETDEAGPYPDDRRWYPWPDRRDVVLEIPEQLLAKPVKPEIHVTVKPAGAGGRFTLESLVDFRWQAAVDGVEIDEAKFRALVEGKRPFLRLGERWVTLDGKALAALRRLWRARPPAPAASPEGEGDGQPGHRSGLSPLISLIASVEDDLDVRVTAPAGEDLLPVEGVAHAGSAGAHDAFRQMWSLFHGYAVPTDIAKPRGLQAELRPYQRRGLAWLAFMGQLGLGACLADDMGLGKTVQGIALLQHLKERGLLGRPALIICPTSVVETWNREIRRFAPTLAAHIHHGPDRPAGNALRRMLNDGGLDAVITSYGIALRDVEALRDVTWSVLIADEAQHMKNPAAKQTRAVKSLRAEQRIALTGTPIENRLEELWSIMDFLNPGYLGSAEQFHRAFALPIEDHGDQVAARMLRRLVRPFILRRLKEDETIAPELPRKRENKLYCRLTAEQAALYQATVEDMMHRIEGSVGMQRRGLVLAALNRLKQICNHPAQLMKAKQAPPERSDKMLTLLRHLTPVMAGGEKALVFTQYVTMGRLLQSTLADAFNTEVLFLHGSVPRTKRAELIERFQESSWGPRLFVLSLRAGGVGINLTRATHVFHYDRWWNPAVEAQATDRAHRIGQQEAVHVHTLICRGTLEERIDAMIEEKRQLADDILLTGEQWLTELSTDELADIFALRETAVGS